METRAIKTIDVQCYEWFDKINGNSYFAGVITVNHTLKNEVTINLSFQYGYGDHYREIAFKAIKEKLNCFKACDERTAPWRAYEQYNIKTNHSKQENCLKRQLMQY